MRPLLDSILENIAPPQGDLNGPLQIRFSSLDYDDYVGRIGIGRVERGTVQHGQQVALCKTDGTVENVKFPACINLRGCAAWRCRRRRSAIWLPYPASRI